MDKTDFDDFGISFKRLSKEQIEMVRLWRNSDDVRPYMQYQELISPDEQKLWFQNLDQETNYYFIAYSNENPFGIFNIKDIDFNLRIGEVGVFVKNRSFWEGELTTRASLLLLKFAFEQLKLKFVISHVLKKNKKAIAFNKQMGFQIDDKIKSPNSYQFRLTREHFYENNKIKKLFKYFNSNQ